MRFRSGIRRLCGPVLAVASVWLAPAAMACTVSAGVSGTLGTYSPAAVNAGVVPALRSSAGISCQSAVLVLLGGNYINAKFRSQNGFLLKQQSGTGTVEYVASADSGGTYVFAQNSTINYMQNNLLNLLGLLGGSTADLPIFVKPKGGALPPPGTYTDTITIDWDWYLCPGIGALFLCIGTPDSGSGRSTITVTLVVTPQNVTMTTSSTTTWDPVNATLNPKALPRSKRRQSVTVANPDLVPIDNGTIRLVLPTPAGSRVALDGDGASSGAAIRLSEGTPASGLTLAYAGPGDAADDVDFSSDGGASWTYVPVAGNAVSEQAITHVRLRPRGAMARQSSFAVSLPYALK